MTTTQVSNAQRPNESIEWTATLLCNDGGYLGCAGTHELLVLVE